MDNKSINSPLPTLHLYDMPCIRVGYTTVIIGKPCSPSFTRLQVRALLYYVHPKICFTITGAWAPFQAFQRRTFFKRMVCFLPVAKRLGYGLVVMGRLWVFWLWYRNFGLLERRARRVRNILESHLFPRAKKNVPDESIVQH